MPSVLVVTVGLCRYAMGNPGAYVRERRSDERRESERRDLFERRVMNVLPHYYYETRFVPDRRQPDRRERGKGGRETPDICPGRKQDWKSPISSAIIMEGIFSIN